MKIILISSLVLGIPLLAAAQSVMTLEKAIPKDIGLGHIEIALPEWLASLNSKQFPWYLDNACQPKCPVIFLIRCFPLRDTRRLCAALKYVNPCCQEYQITTLSPITPTPNTTELCDKLDNQSSNLGLSTQSDSGDKCSDYFNRQCECKLEVECEYHIPTGKCLPRQKQCEDELFTEFACRRNNSFYSVGGVLCLNVNNGPESCPKQMVVLAVNVNGNEFEDSRGIRYVGGVTVPFEDEFFTKRNLVTFQNYLGPDRLLYSFLSVGEANGRQLKQCLVYPIQLETGHFELVTKSIEPFYGTTGKRIFTVMINEVVAIPHVDLFALGGLLSPVDLVINFQLGLLKTQNGTQVQQLIVNGHPPVITNATVKIKFCVSDCVACNDNGYYRTNFGYAVSAFSLVKLVAT